MTYRDAPPLRRALPPSPQVCMGHGDLPAKGIVWEGQEGNWGQGSLAKPTSARGSRSLLL